MVKAYKTLVLSLIYIFLPIATNAQHQELIDSLENLNSFDRRRLLVGYSESRADILNQKGQRDIMLAQVKKFAEEKDDEGLLWQINLIKKIQSSVMNLPRNEREQKIRLYLKNNKDAETVDDLFYLGFCYHELGQILFQNQKYGEAFENDLKALETYRKIGYEKVPNIGKVLHEIALHYYYFKDYDEVIKLMKHSLRFPPFSPGIDMQRYNNIAISYEITERYDSVEYFYNKGLEAAETYKSEIWKGIFLGNLGRYYYKTKNYKAALDFSLQNYNYNKNESQHSMVRLTSYINLGKIYLELDSVSKARNYLNMVEQSFSAFTQDASHLGSKYLGDRQQIEATKRNYFEAKVLFLKKTGDYKNAIDYQDSLMMLRQEIEGKYNATVGKMAFDRITIQNKELELAEKEREKARQQLAYMGLILVIFIGGGTGYFHLYKSKQKRKRQNERLIASNKISILEKQQTKKNLEIAQNEINHFISRIQEQNTIISNFEKDLAQLEKLQENEQKQIDEALNNMKTAKILTDEDWIIFQNNFDLVVPEFRNYLKQEIPSLTGSEVRYLMLTKLNFTHKEMARALGVSDAAIRVTWNRVRKKLNGTLEDTPEDLLEQIFQQSPFLSLELN